MTPLASLLRDPYAIFIGWTLVVVLWATTIGGLLFAAWRLLQGVTRSSTEYRAGLVALFASASFAAILPVALAVWAGRTPAPDIVANRVWTSVRTTLMPLAPAAATGIEHRRGEPTLLDVPIDTLAATAALVWAAGVLALALRLAGGWILARRIARRARPVRDEALARMSDVAAARAGVRQRFALLESFDVEAPVVLRWRRPILLVPGAALPRLGPDHVSALLIHELAHIRRRDYLVNLLQSIVELPLFFCPAVRWMSRRVREAREFCCDDDAVAHCGDRVTYVEALTTLAALSTMNTAHGMQGISGPRLITRVRRLLQEEPMPRFTALRACALVIGLVALVITGIQLSAASASRTPLSPVAGPPSQAGVPKVPSGYASEQEGSGVKLRVVTDAGLFQSARLENVSTEPVAAVRLLAAVERRQNGVSMPVRVFVTEELPVSLAPHGTVDIKTTVLTQEQLDEVAREAPGARVQVFYALQAVRFANGYGWDITPNRDARSGSDAIGTPRPILPRAFIERNAAKAPVPSASCVDNRDREYSQGALVSVLNEPGRFVRCTDGRWVDSR